MISTPKKTVLCPQLDEIRVSCLVNPAFTKVGLLAINAKNFHSLIAYGIDQLTPELSDTGKKLQTVSPSISFVGGTEQQPETGTFLLSEFPA
jgi:hypothetical protein